MANAEGKLMSKVANSNATLKVSGYIGDCKECGLMLSKKDLEKYTTRRGETVITQCPRCGEVVR